MSEPEKQRCGWGGGTVGLHPCQVGRCVGALDCENTTGNTADQVGTRKKRGRGRPPTKSTGSLVDALAGDELTKGPRLVYLCGLCGEGIDRDDPNPCAMIIVSNWSGPESEQVGQQFWCHEECFARVLHERVRGELIGSTGRGVAELDR